MPRVISQGAFEVYVRGEFDEHKVPWDEFRAFVDTEFSLEVKQPSRARTRKSRTSK